MAQPTKKDHARNLRDAEAQFRLMAAVCLACSLKNQPLTVPDIWIFGQEKVRGHELKLHANDAEYAAAVLEHTISFSLCLVATQAIKDTVPKPEDSGNPDITAAWQIVRLLGNAYRHQPFTPVWNFEEKFAKKLYEIKDVIRLDTTGLNGRRVKWQDYGGLLKLFRLSKWIRRTILDDNHVERPAEDAGQGAENTPRIIQQGRMIFERIDEIPPGVTVIEVGDKPVKIGEDADGPYMIVRDPRDASDPTKPPDTDRT